MIKLASSNRPLLSINPDNRLRARTIDDVCELEVLVPAWRQLIDNCQWRNPCYEPGFLIPLFQHCRQESVQILAVEAFSDANAAPELWALIPIVCRPFYRLPFRCAHTWRPDEAFDSTPLLHAEHASAALQGALEALSVRGVRLLAMDTVSGDPGFDQLIKTVAQTSGLSIFGRNRFSRAALRPDGTADEYLQGILSKNRRKKARRLRKNLEEMGEVKFEHTLNASEVQDWALEFVDLEASGWKGRQGTAIASQSDSLAFFMEMTQRLAVRQSIRLARLTLDSKPIAMLVDICSGGHVSAYKTAFDERYSEHSPGFLIELENIRWLHELDCTICDSCTDPNNEMINRLYRDRLPFQDLAIGLDKGMNPWVNAALPMMQKIARRVKQVLRRGPVGPVEFATE